MIYFIFFCLLIDGFFYDLSLALTKLDILTTLKELKIATAYKYEGKQLDSFPASIDQLAKVEVVYETFEGWNDDISNCRKFEDLPDNAKKYVKFIEDFLKVPSKLNLFFSC